MNLRAHKDLQATGTFHGHGMRRRLWLVVGGPGRVWLAHPGFDRRAALSSIVGQASCLSGKASSPTQTTHNISKPHQTGGTPVPRSLRRTGFTLIELVLVLALLAMAVAISAPSLSRFFRGRTLDNEARRLLSLTRYAQSRAVSEGMPMLLWLKPQTGEFGLQSETTYTDTDPRAVNYTLSSDLQMEADSLAFTGESLWKQAELKTGSRQVIRFTPEGFVADSSPAWVWLKTTDGSDAAWLVLSTNRLNYELGSLQPDLRR